MLWGTKRSPQASLHLQGFSCSKGLCRDVMLKDVQPGTAEDVFKCVVCGHTTPARTVDGTGPLDIEQQADDMYRDAVGVLRQQVCGPVPQPKAFTAFANILMLLAEKLLPCLQQVPCITSYR